MLDSKTIGINLETLECYSSMRPPDILDGGDTPKIPPSMVLPSGSHEAQLDQWFPPYPIGLGDSWPDDAAVDNGYTRRMPIGLLWEYGKSERIWKADRQTSVDPIESIGHAARAIVTPSTEFAGLVIPNWLRQSQQQALLDSLSGSGVKWYLVWRPIAAATEWLDRFALAPPNTRKRKCVGRLVVLHLGLFECEFTVVEIVADPVDGSINLLPARLRTDKSADFRSGVFSDTLLAEAAASQKIKPISPSLWKQLWATPWLRRQINAMSQVRSPPMTLSPRDFDPPAIPLKGNHRPQPMVSNAGIQWPVESFARIQNWIEMRLRSVGPVEGAIVTGELAGVKQSSRTLGAALLKDSRIPSEKVLVSCTDHEVQILASGAAKQCAKLAKSEPAYLTKLPLLRTVVSRAGEPEWISLLADDDAYVYGGRKWERPVPVGGIRIPGSRILKLAIDHEDFESVREATIVMPDSFLANQEAELLVEITPAQGNAKVEVATVPRIKTRSPLTANLRKMDEVKNEKAELLSPQQYLDWYPRLAPPILPRLGSSSSWRNIAEQFVVPLIRRDPRTWEAFRIKKIKELLLQKRNAGTPVNITAIGSDGAVNSFHQELSELIVGAAGLLVSRDHDLKENATRMIAYTSTDAEVVPVHIQSWGRSGPQKDEQFRMVGNCLRNPVMIESFLLGCEPSRLSTNHVRTIAELASYRSNALESINSRHLEALYEAIAVDFSRNAGYSNLGLHFRYLTMCAAFLLRRRIFDDAFLPPDGPIAERIKQTCLDVIERNKKGRVNIMGGSVDVPAIMQQLINYVDREGHGAFVLAI